MKVISLTFDIKIKEDDLIDSITTKWNAPIDANLLCRFLNAVSNVRDEYNKERQDEV